MTVVSRRPVGLAWLSDGALLVSDDLSGSIFRIDYVGQDLGITGLVTLARGSFRSVG